MKKTILEMTQRDSQVPIYGTYLRSGEYLVTVGEKPTLTENGLEVDESVPSFTISSFPGSHLLSENPRTSFLLHIESSDYHKERSLSSMDYEKELRAEISRLGDDIQWCSLGTYTHGLWNRFKAATGKFCYGKGEYLQILSFRHQPRKGNPWSFSFTRTLDNGSIYFCLETDLWWRFLFLRDNEKWCLKYSKRENTHTYTSI